MFFEYLWIIIIIFTFKYFSIHLLITYTCVSHVFCYIFFMLLIIIIYTVKSIFSINKLLHVEIFLTIQFTCFEIVEWLLEKIRKLWEKENHNEWVDIERKARVNKINS